jgi:hypothetical protein
MIDHKTRMTVVTLFVFTFGILATAQNSAPPSDRGPSLEDTMKFIREKLEAKANPSMKFKYKSESFAADPANCQLTETSLWTNGGGATYTFSFREVEKIEVTPFKNNDGNPGASLKVSMTSNNSVRYKYKSGKGERLTGEWVVGFQDEDMANRVAQAMVHAVELCGGGKKKDEPF